MYCKGLEHIFRTLKIAPKRGPKKGAIHPYTPFLGWNFRFRGETLYTPFFSCKSRDICTPFLWGEGVPGGIICPVFSPRVPGYLYAVEKGPYSVGIFKKSPRMRFKGPFRSTWYNMPLLFPGVPWDARILSWRGFKGPRRALILYVFPGGVFPGGFLYVFPGGFMAYIDIYLEVLIWR